MSVEVFPDLLIINSTYSLYLNFNTYSIVNAGSKDFKSVQIYNLKKSWEFCCDRWVIACGYLFKY